MLPVENGRLNEFCVSLCTKETIFVLLIHRFAIILRNMSSIDSDPNLMYRCNEISWKKNGSKRGNIYYWWNIIGVCVCFFVVVEKTIPVYYELLILYDCGLYNLWNYVYRWNGVTLNLWNRWNGVTTRASNLSKPFFLFFVFQPKLKLKLCLEHEPRILFYIYIMFFANSLLVAPINLLLNNYKISF